MTTERDPVRAALADKIACANLVTMHHWNAQMGWDDETELTSEDQDVIVAALNAPLPGRLDCGALVIQWRQEAHRHRTAQADCDIGDDDWFLHNTEADRLNKCASELSAALPPTLNSGALAERLRAHAEYLDQEECGGTFSMDLMDASRILALPRAVDGGAAGEREAAIHDALLGLIEAVELDSDTGGKGISGYTAARLHDARETLSAFPRSECSTPIKET